jgi:hypothetical protein
MACCGVSKINHVLKDIAKSVTLLSPTDLAASRHNTCRECESYVNITENTHRCNSCGCVIEWKVKLQVTTCPLGKWL